MTRHSVVGSQFELGLGCSALPRCDSRLPTPVHELQCSHHLCTDAGAAAGAGEGPAQRRTSTAQLNQLFGELDSLERNFRRMSSSRKAPIERVMLLEEAGRQGLAALPEEQSGVF